MALSGDEIAANPGLYVKRTADLRKKRDPETARGQKGSSMIFDRSKVRGWNFELKRKNQQDSQKTASDWPKTTQTSGYVMWIKKCRPSHFSWGGDTRLRVLGLLPGGAGRWV